MIVEKIKKLQADLYGLGKYIIKNICYLFGRVRNNKIVFDNFSGKGYGCNPKYIAEEIIKQGIDCDMVWLVNNLEEEIPHQIRKVKIGSIKAFWELATAKIWIDNVRVGNGIRKKKNQFYIQTWHGELPNKYIEADAEDSLSPEYVKAAKQDAKRTDLMFTSNTFQEHLFRNAFWYDGKILKCGIPRNDIIFHPTEAIKHKVYQYFHIDNHYKIALYAPTFRNQSDLSVYTFDYQKCCDELEKKFGGKFVLLIRLHPIVQAESKEITYNERILNATLYPDMQELIAISDVLISDYSGIIFTFLRLNKPTFLLAKDLENYKKSERKFYFDWKDFSESIALTSEELINNIRHFSEETFLQKTKSFIDKMGFVENENASRIIVDIIKEKMET